jgi:tetratricopeptide (TPR) repeat protein
MLKNKKSTYLKEMEKGNYALALTLLDSEIQKDQNNPVLLYNFAICCSRTDNHKKCISILLQLIQYTDRYIEIDNVYKLIIYSYIQLNELDNALLITDDRLKVNVGDLVLLSFRANILERKGLIREAIQIHRNILKIRHDYKNSLNSIAYLIAILPDATPEELNESIDCIKLALSLDPNNAAYLDTFGVILKAKGQKEAAKMALQKAIALSRNVNSTILEHLQDLL